MTVEELTSRWDSLDGETRDRELRALCAGTDRPNPYAASLTLRAAWRMNPQDRPRMAAYYGYPGNYPEGMTAVFRN